jgi:hypothetical protein
MTFLLSSRDRHASGIAQSTSAVAAIEVEVEVEAFFGSEEEALRAETRCLCALRRSRDQYGIGVCAVPGHEYSVRDGDITLQITTPCTEAGHVIVPPKSTPNVAQVGSDSAFDQVSLPLMDSLASITVAEKTQQINLPPNRYIRGKFDVLSSSETATALEAQGSAYINNNDFPMSIIPTTDAQIVGRSSPASIHDSESDRFFPVDSHSLNGPLGIRFVGPASGEALDLDVSECNLGTVPLPCILRVPFELLAATILLSVNEGPAGRLRNRCVNSRIVRRGVCLVPDVK